MGNSTSNKQLQAIIDDLTALVKEKNCGPILIRLSWHDAGVFSTGKLTGGCPNAAMRFAEAGEGAFGANAGLPTVALDLLKPISEKYCPDVISNADLWTLAANVAIEVMVSLGYLMRVLNLTFLVVCLISPWHLEFMLSAHVI